jgi:hypothetical protein
MHAELRASGGREMQRQKKAPMKKMPELQEGAISDALS